MKNDCRKHKASIVCVSGTFTIYKPNLDLEWKIGENLESFPIYFDPFFFFFFLPNKSAL